MQKYVIAKTLVKDVIFEETYDTSLQPESSSGNGGTTGGGTNTGGNTGGNNTGGGNNNGGDGDDTGEND